MAVRIRLRRIGKKKQPQYRLVVAESAGPRDGRFIESIGQYNPRVHPAAISVNEERALHWLQHGAQPSDTARSLLVKTGVWERYSGKPAAAPAARAVPAAPPVEHAAAEEKPTAVSDQPTGEMEEAEGTPVEEASG